MSAEEDTELRDLVTQTLEANGVLGRIRAELRASVFLALEEQDPAKSRASSHNPALKQFLCTKEGLLTVSLVKEFLEYFTLDFTSSVFGPESNLNDDFEDRETLAKEIGIVDNDKTKSKPLLSELLKRSSEEKHGRHRSWSGAEYTRGGRRKSIDEFQELTDQQIVDAREKFTMYDKDNSGSIEKDELRTLFSDIFPHFHRNMLDRYVNDEFKAVDRDFSNAIDFEEFLGMYRRLFVLCRSVVSHDVSELVLTSPRVKPLKTIKESKIPVFNKKSTVDSKASTKSTSSDDSLKDPLSQPIAISDLKTTSNGEEALKPTKDVVPENGLLQKNKNGSGLPPSSLGNVGGGGMSSLSGAPLLGGGSSLGSLKNAPPLPGLSSPTLPKDGNKTPDLKEIVALEDQIKELEFNNPKNDDGDNYEDDFYSSQGSQSQQSKQSMSDVHNEKNDDPISEEIEEDLSFEDDFLESSNDKFDDLTTDRTASQQSGSGLDFIEDVLVLP